MAGGRGKTRSFSSPLRPRRIRDSGWRGLGMEEKPCFSPAAPTIGATCSRPSANSLNSGASVWIISACPQPPRIWVISTPFSRGRWAATGASAMRYFKLWLAPALGGLLACAAAFAQAPNYGNLGRAPSKDEIQAWNQSIGPEGKELPPGSGTAKQGEEIFASKCAACHGPAGEGSQLAPRLVGGRGALNIPTPSRTLANYWPFATTIWDYINRAMPPKQQGSLSAGDVYALTAFILYRNEIIPE